MSGVLSEIMIYPVKSMAGVALTSALVEQRGLQHDRRFMLVNQGRKFVNGREFPQLLQIRGSCQLEGDGLLIEGPSSEPLTIEFDSEPLVIQTTVWRSTVNALTVSPIADEWFSTYLGMACKLVFMGDESRRSVDPDYGAPDDEVSFAEAFPILVVSQAALDELNDRLDDPLSMHRFRPNLVIAGCSAHAEDAWRRIRVGEVELVLVKRCDRCSITTFDPRTAERHAQSEPLRTLASYRQGEDGRVYFWTNAIPRRTGYVRAGDAVTVLNYGALP